MNSSKDRKCEQKVIVKCSRHGYWWGSSSKKIKFDKGKYVIDLEVENKSINQGGVIIVEEEHSMSSSRES